jgi:FixJ family two-component response regulator
MLNLPPVDVVVVDGVEDTLLMLGAVLRSAGYAVLPMRNTEGLTDIAKSRSPGCILLDLFASNAGGPNLVRELCAIPQGAPLVVMSGPIRTSIVVDAIKCGAVDFLEKPFDLNLLLACVKQTVSGFRRRFENPPLQPLSRSFPGKRLLTERENEILGEISQGGSSKEVGRRLGISPRTVDVHRAHIKKKLHARRAVDLVRIVYDAEHS